ncbi:MAG: carbon-phosphorus lyase complex subunit PhnI [Deltaproteobacteria bacterium]|jgi:alpha-D-ribose 1-methylphosphonate 5-triphosphate synthase subunit PhnI|nr:carbon-phosphorus lyase complex subunit PhnI [Deltaproteobacteria bacterium]
MYVAVKGGKKAIEAAHKLLDETRRGDPGVPELTIGQLGNQLGRAVDRVQAEGSLYAPMMAALAVKQAQGDLVEAIFLIRAARASLRRFGYSEPVETKSMRPRRRISGTFKDIPGGQILGATFDYTHRLLKSALANCQAPSQASPRLATPVSPVSQAPAQDGGRLTGVATILEREGILETVDDSQPQEEPFDLTREPLRFPMGRPGRLQSLSRADEGFLLSLAYSSQRGFGSVHPFVAELRLGPVEVEINPPEVGMAITIGQIELTECQTANQFKGGGGKPPMFTRGYGLCFGHNERKALSMAIVDRALRSVELGEPLKGPAQNEEFVLYHGDNVEASGFVSHIKLPHYVDFQAELFMLREARKKLASAGGFHKGEPVPGENEKR